MEKVLSPEEMPPREALSGRYRFRTPLRCEGVGKLDCVADLNTGQRKVVRWLPLEANGYSEQDIVHFCADLPMHSGLPEVCEIGELDAWAYMVVDFPEGDLLSARKELLEPEAWREMAYQLSGALSALHAAQVFHGEFCMPSVMLLEAGRPLLWDAQLVLCDRMADRRQGERVLQQLVRTVSTMAPERARGGPLSSEADVYSLGAVLAYSAGSAQPAHHPTLALVHALAVGDFVPFISNALPSAYQDMLARMLAPQAEDRPDMREVEACFAPLPLNTSPSPSSVSPPVVNPAPPPPPSTSAVSGVEWIHMLSPEESPPSPPPKAATPKPEAAHARERKADEDLPF
jgi:serine/threonine-protein kinase